VKFKKTKGDVMTITKRQVAAAMLLCIAQAANPQSMCQGKSGFAREACRIASAGKIVSLRGAAPPPKVSKAPPAGAAEAIRLDLLTMEPTGLAPLEKLRKLDTSFILRPGAYEGYVKSNAALEPKVWREMPGGYFLRIYSVENSIARVQIIVPDGAFAEEGDAVPVFNPSGFAGAFAAAPRLRLEITFQPEK
jgi:hypothetical protein